MSGGCIFETISGKIWNGDGFTDGSVTVEDGTVAEVSFVDCGDCRSYILPGIVDCHTHVADSGLKLDRRYGLRELVAPPDGLKHRYLEKTDNETLLKNMADYSKKLVSNGVSKFIDFRENGINGCRLLRKASDRAVILGRPVSETYDDCEINGILDVADGIGISGIGDLEGKYLEKISETVRKRGKMLALHLSEWKREDAEFAISLEPDFVVHMVKGSREDFRRCAEADVPIAVCASSNLYFDMVPNIKQMIDSGADVAIGTDNGMLSPSADILSEFHVFWKILSEQGGSPSEAYTSFLNASGKIIKQKNSISEQTGRRADLLVVDRDPLCSGCRSVRYGP